jgi:hypothetical protein
MRNGDGQTAAHVGIRDAGENVETLGKGISFPDPYSLYFPIYSTGELRYVKLEGANQTAR